MMFEALDADFVDQHPGEMLDIDGALIGADTGFLQHGVDIGQQFGFLLQTVVGVAEGLQAGVADGDDIHAHGFGLAENTGVDGKRGGEIVFLQVTCAAAGGGGHIVEANAKLFGNGLGGPIGFFLDLFGGTAGVVGVIQRLAVFSERGHGF